MQQTDLEPSDDHQGVNVVDPELLGNLLQVFPRKSSGPKIKFQFILMEFISQFIECFPHGRTVLSQAGNLPGQSNHQRPPI